MKFQTIPWTQFANAETRKPMPHIDAHIQRLSLDHPGHETARERVPSSIRIVDLTRANLPHLVALDAVLALHRHERRLRALRDDGHPLSRSVLLGEVR